ncbi:MAG: phage tail assembly chaperone [Paracoccaceae bacterium]
MSAIDWPGLLRAGLNGLRLTPGEFWRLSPVELMIMLGADAATPPLTRARLDELARAFPDVRKGQDNG